MVHQTHRTSVKKASQLRFFSCFSLLCILLLPSYLIFSANPQGCVIAPNCSVELLITDQNNNSISELRVPKSGEKSLYLSPSATPDPNEVLPQECQETQPGLVALIYVIDLLTINTNGEGVFYEPTKLTQTLYLNHPTEVRFVLLVKPLNIADHKIIFILSVFANKEDLSCLIAKVNYEFPLIGTDDTGRDAKTLMDQKIQDDQTSKVVGWLAQVWPTIPTSIGVVLWTLIQFFFNRKSGASNPTSSVPQNVQQNPPAVTKKRAAPKQISQNRQVASERRQQNISNHN